MNKMVFHIGHHKTATTWLQTGYFSEHPEVNLISDFQRPWNDRFLNYLIGSTERNFNISVCTNILNEQLSTQDNYLSKVNLISAERLSGHPYSGGYDSFILANRIYSCFPKASIIIGIRNQIEMLISVYKQLVIEGYCGNFTEFLESKQWKGTSFSLDFYKYQPIILKYFELFSPENVLILLYEDLVRDRTDFINQISSFLKIADFKPSNLRHVAAKGKNNRDIQVLRFLNHFRKTELNPFPLIEFNLTTIEFLSKALKPLIKEKVFITDKNNEYLKNYYHEPNIELRKILQRDLSYYP